MGFKIERTAIEGGKVSMRLGNAETGESVT